MKRSDNESTGNKKNCKGDKRRNERIRYKKINNETRQKLIEMVYLKDYLLKDAANELNINYSTAKTILRIFRIEKRMLKKKSVERHINHKEKNYTIHDSIPKDLKVEDFSNSSGKDFNSNNEDNEGNADISTVCFKNLLSKFSLNQTSPYENPNNFSVQLNNIKSSSKSEVSNYINMYMSNSNDMSSKVDFFTKTLKELQLTLNEYHNNVKKNDIVMNRMFDCMFKVNENIERSGLNRMPVIQERIYKNHWVEQNIYNSNYMYTTTTAAATANNNNFNNNSFNNNNFYPNNYNDLISSKFFNL